MSEALAPGAWIYVMWTPSDPNRFKIGRTRNNPLNRAKQLRTGDPYLALAAAYFVPAAYGLLSKIEMAVHRELQGRIAFEDGSPSEWFQGTPGWACYWIEGVFEDWWAPVRTGHEIGGDSVAKAEESDLEAYYGLCGPVGAFDDLPM